MDDRCEIDSIGIDALDALLQDYSHVVPEKLARLDQQRYEFLPRALEDRKDTPRLTKSEVAILVDWKLSHGKFRPALKGLFGQNTEQAVLDVTRDAFAAFSGSSESAQVALNSLTRLRGIGPATASLLLSVYDPHTVPFFSDELFRWSMYEEARGRGWDREIKYNLREYLQLFEKVHELQDRLIRDSQRKVAAVDIEKLAYVLEKRALEASNEGVSKGSRRGTKRKTETIELNSLQAANALIKVAKTTDAKRPTRRSISRKSAPSEKRAAVPKSEKRAL